MGKLSPSAFIDEEIQVEFPSPPLLSKKPGPPQRLHWRGSSYRVEAVLSRWFDYQRRGRMAKNMRPMNLLKAKRRGSWGVGRFYFRLRVEGGRVFDIYFDRAPDHAGDRQGRWVLWRELTAE